MAPPASGAPLPRGPEPLAEADPVSLLRAAEVCCRRRRRPVMLVGNGVVRQRAGAGPARLLRADRPARHHHLHGQGRRRRGRRRTSCSPPACAPRTTRRACMGRADLVVCVGYDMIEWPPSAWNPDGRQRIVCIDTVPPEIDAHYVPEVELIGDLGAHPLSSSPGCSRASRSARLETRPYRRGLPPRARRRHATTTCPSSRSACCATCASSGAARTCSSSDVGAHKLWVARFWEAREPNTVLISNGFAAMGFGLPAAIAAALARRGRGKVVVHQRRRRLPDERAGARDGAPSRPALRRPRLERRRLRPHRDAPAAQVRPHRRDALRQPRPRRRSRARSASRASAPRRPATSSRSSPRPSRHPGPVVVDIPIDYAENDKLAVDLWQLAPEALA